jgi:hypothetical protein
MLQPMSPCYTPIVIQWLPSALDADGNPLTELSGTGPNMIPPSYWLKITSPTSNRKGLYQHLPETLRVKIPPDGLLRMQLIPSDFYLPRGVYKVEYFRTGSSIPINTEEWIVPECPSAQTHIFPYSSSNSFLPPYIWSILKVTPGGFWTAEYNNLVWTGPTAPEENALISVLYTPAVTLDQLKTSSLCDAKPSTWC